MVATLLMLVLSSLPFGYFSSPTSSSTKNVHYTVQEESDSGTFVGNPLRDALVYPTFTDQKALARAFIFKLMFGNREMFSLNETTGDLTTTERLDRESLCGRQHHQGHRNHRKLNTADAIGYANVSLLSESPQKCQVELSIVVSRGDDNLLETWINVHVAVLDINDNKPYFDQNQWNITLSESTPTGSSFKLPLALDADEPDHAVRRYALFDESQPKSCRNFFSISCDTKLVECDLRLEITKALDFEICKYHSLLLYAEDSFPDSGVALPLRVFVKNENENAPAFVEPPDAPFSVPRDTPVGAFITQLDARDDDGDDSTAEITYSTNSPFFEVAGGRVVLHRSLWQYHGNRINLVIVAKDGGTPAKQTPMTLQIDVIDTGGKSSEGAPVFSIFLKPLGGETVGGPEAYLLIPNSAEKGRLIALIWTDSSVDAACQFRNNISSLAIEKAGLLMGSRPTFTLKVMRAYNFSSNYETVRRSVESEDAHVSCGDANMRLRLRLAPPASQQFQFPSNQIRVFVEESSSPIVGFHTLSPIKGVGHLFFVKDSTSPNCDPVRVHPRLGSLTIPFGIDRERTPELHCIFSATDSDQPPTKITLLMFITVTDINDCAPSLNQLEYSVPEFDHLAPVSRNQWRPLVKLVATDSDAGLNGSVGFELSGIRTVQGSTGYRPPIMRLSPMTGELAVRVSDYHLLDREEVSEFVLLVYLYDLGTPFRLSASFEVKLTLLDVNDNAPVFVDAEKNGVLEGLPWYQSFDPVPGVWTQIRVFDPDLGENGTTKISIVDPGGGSHVVRTLSSHQVSLFEDGRLWISHAILNRTKRNAIHLQVTDFGSRRQFQTKAKLIVDRDPDRSGHKRPQARARATHQPSAAVGFVTQSAADRTSLMSSRSFVILLVVGVGVVVCVIASIPIAYLVLRK